MRGSLIFQYQRERSSQSAIVETSTRCTHVYHSGMLGSGKICSTSFTDQTWRASPFSRVCFSYLTPSPISSRTLIFASGNSAGATISRVMEMIGKVISKTM